MYISIDIGGTNIRVAGSKTLDNPNFSDIHKVEIKNDYDKDLGILKKAISEFGEHIDGIGLSLPIMFPDKAKSTGTLLNLNSWSLKPIKEDFKKMFDTNVVIENDAACAALGEAYYGSGIEKNFIFLIWGTGVGGTEVKNDNGNISYNPMEPGHDVIVEENGREGACGHKGDLESYAGGGSIEKHYGKKAKDLPEDDWNEVTDNFAIGITKLMSSKPTELIIFGGGVAINQPERVKQIEDKVKKELGDNSPDMIISKLGDNAGLYGALGLLK